MFKNSKVKKVSDKFPTQIYPIHPAPPSAARTQLFLCVLPTMSKCKDKHILTHILSSLLLHINARTFYKLVSICLFVLTY